MKYLSYILLFMAFLFISCSKETGSNAPEGMTEVRLEIPDVYINGCFNGTKADSEFLAKETVSKLPVGSTIWLSYSKKGENGYDKAEVKPYIVKGTDDYIGLYPCGIEEYTDSEGTEWMRIEEEVNGTPLYLTTGETYRFRVLYPAYDLRKPDLYFNLYNGIWACINDPRYTQTESRDITLTANSQKITYVDLQPVVNQTARLHFEIAKGDNVHTMEMMHSGIEISGVQDKERAYPMDWTHDEYMDIIQLESIDEGKHWYKLQEFTIQNDKIIGDAYILPLDVRRTYIFILINMAVNGIPTQYVLTLNGIVLEHSRSYNFDLKAGLDGNLTVVNWQNTSMTITPKAE